MHMAIIRLGHRLRLTGGEAANYLKETGRSRLPRTVNEYNQAFEDAAASWAATKTPEGALMSAVLLSFRIAE
jgi:hypothetical protein